MQYSKMTLFLAFAIIPNPRAEGVLLSTKNTASSTQQPHPLLPSVQLFFVKDILYEVSRLLHGSGCSIGPVFPSHSLKLR